jgi:transcription antitermination factor NusG
MFGTDYQDLDSKSVLFLGRERRSAEERAAGLELERQAWFAIHVRSKCESRAYSELSARGFEAFLPLRQVKRRWSDRDKTMDDPVFPGYLFCRFGLSNRFRVLNVPGVARIVGAGLTPIAIPDDEIRSVERLVESRMMLHPWPYLKSGQRVRIDRGPLEGLEGMVIRAADGSPRVVVSVALLQRSVAAEIDRDWITVQ